MDSHASGRVAAKFCLVAALTLSSAACGKDENVPDSDPEATESAQAEEKEEKEEKKSTEKIADRIKTRLDQNSGLNTKLDCPEKVSFEPKTKFECPVYDAAYPDDDPLNIVEVTIEDRDGYYTWESIGLD